MNPHPRSFLHWLPALAVLSVAWFFGGCANFEPGTPVAAVTIRASSGGEVMDVVERVFTGEGYRMVGHTYDSVTFETDGTKTDAVMHGNWMGDSVVVRRALVVVADKGSGKYRVRCTPQMVRNRGQGDFEDTHRRAQLVSFHYSGLLRKVRNDFR